MLESPFAFLRGSAAVMASDLAPTPVTGLEAVLCGDAHLSNFGLFATPERTLVFDINDFDEVYIGAWEWDLKRLAASAAVAGRDNGFSDKTCRRIAKTVAATYHDAMKRFSTASTLDMWYFQVEADVVQSVVEARVPKKSRKRSRKVIGKGPPPHSGSDSGQDHGHHGGAAPDCQQPAPAGAFPRVFLKL